MRLNWRGGLPVAAVLAAALPEAAAQQAQPQRMTLPEVVAYGLAHSPDLAETEKGVESARARLSSTKAKRLFNVTVTSDATYWDKDLLFDVPIPGAPPMEPTTIREQITTNSQATAVLPLVGQIQLAAAIRGDHGALEASEYDHSARRLGVAADSASAYLNVLLARATSDIAESRAKLVEAQLDRARVLERGGVLGRVDVMRLEATLAGARRDAISAASQAATAEDSLVFTIGLPDGSRIATVDNLPETPTPPPIESAAAVQAATMRRPELRAAGARAQQAHAGASVEIANLLPTVNALGALQHNTGNGPFALENAWFLGLHVSWTVWDWLSTWKAYRSADYQAEQADLAASRLGDQLRLDVRRREREARAAYDSVAVARVGLTAAEEAFRIQEVRFREGATTTTDLLSAETELAAARIDYANARYTYYLQLVALAQATGQLPDALLPATGAR